MNKDSTDFMITEYDRISNAYFGLRDQVNEWFKAYLTLIGLPLTILAVVMKIGENDSNITISSLPDVVSYLLILVSILGLFVTLSIVSMRMEMILYARTINCVRRFFATEESKLVPFLVLPTSDTKPPFYESCRAMFWQVLMIGFIDGIIITVGIYNLIKLSWYVSIVIGILFLIFHWFMYWLFALIRARQWGKKHFDDDLNISKI